MIKMLKLVGVAASAYTYRGYTEARTKKLMQQQFESRIEVIKMGFERQREAYGSIVKEDHKKWKRQNSIVGATFLYLSLFMYLFAFINAEWDTLQPIAVNAPVRIESLFIGLSARLRRAPNSIRNAFRSASNKVKTFYKDQMARRAAAKRSLLERRRDAFVELSGIPGYRPAMVQMPPSREGASEAFRDRQIAELRRARHAQWQSQRQSQPMP